MIQEIAPALPLFQQEMPIVAQVFISTQEMFIHAV
jgi:hypothetical protein